MLMGKDEAAQMLDVSRRTIDRMVAAKELEHVVLSTPTGRRPIVKFSREAIEAYIERATVKVGD